MLRAILNFFRQLFGPRFNVWVALNFLALVIFVLALVTGVFHKHEMVRAGPFILVQGFALSTFLILIPFGYLIQHFREAISLRFIGWIYFLYVLGGLLLIGYGIWLRSSQYLSGEIDALNAFGHLYAGLIYFMMYTWIAIPLAIVLLVFRKREPAT